MSDTLERMFVCEHLPTTRTRVFVGVILLSAVTAGALLFVTGWIAQEGRLFGLMLAEGLAWLVLRCTVPNPPLGFYREWLQRQGWRVPDSALLPPSPAWLMYLTVGLPFVSPYLSVAAMVAVAVSVNVIRRVRAGATRSLRSLVREYIEIAFVYVGYPDQRFTSPAGTGGLWLPAVTRGQRRWSMALGSLPLLYAPLVAMTVPYSWLGNDNSGLVAATHTIGAATLLALPMITAFAMQAGPIAALTASAIAPPVARGTEWEQSVELVSNSRLVIDGVALSEHLFLGFHPPAWAAAAHPFKTVTKFDLPCRSPALLHLSILHGNGHITGSLQSGKTSRALISMITQLIRGHNVLSRDAFGQPRHGTNGDYVWGRSDLAPMLIIDMKGDLALFHTCLAECKRRGQTCRYFTLSKGLSTAYFNPITNLNIGERPIVEFCELVCNALSLFHGLSYGRSYYSKQSRDLLIATLNRAPHKPQTWEELHELLLSEIDPKKHKDVFELVSTIFALSQFPMLGPAPAGADVIHMPSVIANREVVFFSLPARLSAISARDVAKLALFCFITAAAEWNDQHPERRCFVFLDEAQIICSSNLAVIFQQCSGAKTTMVLINQARSDLNVPDAPKLSETVRVNTRLQQMFTIVDPRDATDLIKMSGERIGLLRTYSRGRDGKGHATSGVTEKETLCPVLTQNDINHVNNDPAGSYVYITTGAGLTQYAGIPKHVQAPYTMELEEYARRMHTPWPSAPETMQRSDGPKTTVLNMQDVEEVQQTAEDDYARLLSFFKQAARRAGRDRMRDWKDLPE